MKRLFKRHGFTLVELIVVIAIIAVLAAILVPTLTGLVTKARVTSMNNTAASIQRCMDLLLLQSDPTYYGIVLNRTQKYDITVTSGSNGTSTWTCSAAEDGTYNSNNSGHFTWGSGGSYTEGDDASSIRVGEALICSMLCDKVDIDRGSIVIVLNSGKCTFVAYTDATTDPIPESQYPVAVNGRPAAGFVWDGRMAGVSPNGWIVGTAPIIELSRS